MNGPVQAVEERDPDRNAFSDAELDVLDEFEQALAKTRP